MTFRRSSASITHDNRSDSSALLWPLLFHRWHCRPRHRHWTRVRRRPNLSRCCGYSHHRCLHHRCCRCPHHLCGTGGQACGLHRHFLHRLACPHHRNLIRWCLVACPHHRNLIRWCLVALPAHLAHIPLLRWWEDRELGCRRRHCRNRCQMGGSLHCEDHRRPVTGPPPHAIQTECHFRRYSGAQEHGLYQLLRQA